MATEVMQQEQSPAVDASSETPFSVEEDQELLKTLNAKTYKEQAVWFLNAVWKKGVLGEDNERAEEIWSVYRHCVELDKNGEQGNELNEFDAHRLLEKADKALTVREMREVLREIDIDFNRSMSLTEYLVYRYGVNWRELVHAPQGGVDEAKLELAQSKLDEAKADIEASEARAKEAKAAEKEAVEAEAVAKRDAEAAVEADAKAEASAKTAVEAEDRAKTSEDTARANESEAFQEETRAKEAETRAIKAEEEHQAVEEQVREALEVVHREEAAFNDTCKALEDAAEDASKGIVARNKAKAELAQLRSGDPMPLQRAKISQEAVVRRQTRATRSAAQAKTAAQQARAAAEESRLKAVESREAAEEALLQASSRRRKAEAEHEAAREARAAAESAREASEAARQSAEAGREAAEAALAKSTSSFQEAQRFLDKVRRECTGVGKGKIWMMNRELTEQKKYMSKAQLARLEAAPPLDFETTPACA